MIAEALNPPPAPDAPVPIVPQGNSDAEVRERFRQSMAQVPREEPAAPPEPEPKKVEAKEGTVDIPDEFFGEPKTEEDEFDRMMKEEVKGHVKNENFKRMKEMFAQKLAKKEAETAELRAKIPKDDYVPEKTAKQLEHIQKQLQEREELISRKYIEETPEFQEKFTARKESVLNRLQKAAKDLELPPRVVKGLLASDSVKERAEILEEAGINSIAASSVTTILDQYDSVESDRNDYISNWKARAEELEASALAEEDKEKARIKGLYDKAFDDVLGDLTKNNALFQTKEGKEDWNSQTQEIIEKARKNYNAESSTPYKDAEAFLAAAAAERAIGMFNRANQLYRETKKELDELKAAGPGGGHGSDTTVPDPTKNMTADQRAAYAFRQAQAQAGNNGFAQ